MIFTVQPYATDKSKFGEVYNTHIFAAPDDSWILVLDSDCHIILPNEGRQIIEKAIERYPDTAIFGAMTNRVGYLDQCHLREISQDPNYLNHHTIATQLAQTYADGECKPASTVAGFFLLFKKSYWLKSPFQDEIVKTNPEIGFMFFDRAFCLHAKINGLPMRIIKGVYCFHAYRIHKDVNDRSHLYLAQ